MDIVCFSHLRWNFVYQRPQHLLSRMAKHFRIFYIEEPIYDADKPYLDNRREEDKVWIIVPHLRPGLDEAEQNKWLDELLEEFFYYFKLEQYIAWYYTPMAYRPSNVFAAELVIYDCMDELSAFLHAPAALKEKERELMERADIVFTGGYSLYQAKKDKHLNIHLFPSSIDRSHFHRARMMNGEFRDQQDIGYPRIGFFGVIDERLDIQLLDEMARKKPNWHFIMIGPTVKIDPATLPKHANIHYLGQKSYKDLPNYISQWNVAMMPFAINESTRFISPTKTPEYLAAGKPVVSTPIYDVVHGYQKFGFVLFAATADEFIDAIERALSIPNKNKWLKEVDDVLSLNSWDLTVEKMLAQIYATLPKEIQRRKEIDHV
jgi:glycosyltransferase involved in cell wall biosynthesis